MKVELEWKKNLRNKKRKTSPMQTSEVIRMNGESHLTVGSTSSHTEDSSAEGYSHPRDKNHSGSGHLIVE